MGSKLSYVRSVTALMLAMYLALPTGLLAVPSAVEKQLTEEQKIIHVLNRLGFGARPGDVARVKQIGIEKYIEQQLAPESIDDSRAEAKTRHLEIFKMPTSEIFAKYPNPGALLRQLDGPARGQMPQSAEPAMTETQQRERRARLQALYKEYDLRPAGQLVPQIVSNRVIRAVYSERQLQEVMVDFWQNHFNVFAGKAAVRWYIPSYERDVLRKNALGSFRDLLRETAKHPAMLFYLDNFQSVSPNLQAAPNTRRGGPLQRAIREGRLTPRMREQLKRRQGLTDAEIDQRLERARANQQQAGQRMRRGINENYARELLELHTMGVESGYTQKDIVEIARAFTGWTIADPRGYRLAAAGKIEGNENRRLARLERIAGVPETAESGEFYFNERWHDKGEKIVLGKKVTAGGMEDGLQVLDILADHPATAKFIARKLAVKFVNDDPSEELVTRVAAAFTRSKGDIRATLRAIFTDKEFFSPANYRAKIKTPFELAVSSIRALGGETNAAPQLMQALRGLGETPYGYQAPTGYPDTAEDWVNTGALLNRMNFAVAVSSNRMRGTRVDLSGFRRADQKEVLEQAIAVILNNEVSDATRRSLAARMDQPLPDGNIADDAEDDADMTDSGVEPGRRQVRRANLLPPSGDPAVFKVVSLILGSPEFQRQ